MEAEGVRLFAHPEREETLEGGLGDKRSESARADVADGFVGVPTGRIG